MSRQGGWVALLMTKEANHMKNRLYELDGLRALAALCVVFFHYTFSGWVGGTSPVAFAAESAWSKYGYPRPRLRGRGG